MYGSRAQTIINALLAFDAYLAWYFPLKKSIPFLCEEELREERALDNMRTAIDVQEIYERISINNHKSFMPHGAVYKVTKDILRVGDGWACGIQALELQNAETKRVATSAGARNLTMREGGVARCALRVCIKQNKLAPLVGANLFVSRKSYGYRPKSAEPLGA